MRRSRARKLCVCSAARLLGLFLVLSAIAAPLQSCERKTKPKQTEREATDREDEEREAPRRAAKATPSPPTRRIMAAWYPVPPQSLAKRRAPDELTAAHNSLPLGTRVRVTNPDNGRTVVVRITDRGIHDRRVKLDVCKEAAEELGIVREGFADLKIQVLRDEDEVTMADSPSSGSESNHLTKSE